MRHHPDKLEPRTIYQRGRILCAIKNEALTAQQLADRLHLSRDTVNIHLRGMKEARLVYVAGFAFNSNGGRPAPQYRPGSEKDVVYVAARDRLQGHKEIVEKTSERVVQLLARKAMTAAELADVLDMVAAHARWYIGQLRTADNKRLYIKRYGTTDTGYPVAVYATGNKPDAVYVPKTDKQIYAEAMRDPERRTRRLGTVALRRLVKRTRSKPNGIFGALGL